MFVSSFNGAPYLQLIFFYLNKPLSLVTAQEISPDQLSGDELKRLQKAGKSLVNCFKQPPQRESCKILNGVLYRKKASSVRDEISQLVVAQSDRSLIRKLAHNSPLSGHTGSQGNCDQILHRLFGQK